MDLTRKECLLRCRLTLRLQLLCLSSAFLPVIVCSFHMELHGSHAGNRETVSLAGQAHLVVLAVVVVQCLVVSGPEGTQRAEVCIYLATFQLKACPAQGITQVQIPQAHCPGACKAIWVGIHHIYAIWTLAHQHHPVYGHLCVIWHPGALGRLLEFGADFLVELGCVTALLS